MSAPKSRRFRGQATEGRYEPMPLPTTAGTTCITEAEDKLIESLVNSPSFLAFLGAANETEARARMHLDEGPEATEKNELSQAELDVLWPFAMVMTDFEEEAYTQFQVASGPFFSDSGLLGVRLERKANESQSGAEDMRVMKNSAGAIMEEVNVQSATLGRLDVSRSQLAECWVDEVKSRGVKGAIIGAILLFGFGFGDVGGGSE